MANNPAHRWYPWPLRAPKWIIVNETCEIIKTEGRTINGKDKSPGGWWLAFNGGGGPVHVSHGARRNTPNHKNATHIASNNFPFAFRLFVRNIFANLCIVDIVVGVSSSFFFNTEQHTIAHSGTFTKSMPRLRERSIYKGRPGRRR